MRREGVSVKEIHRRLVQVGYTKSYSTLRRHVAKLESNNPSKTQLYRPRRHYDHYPEILNTIVRAYVSDSSTPSSSIRNQLLGKGVTVSSRQVRRLRKMLGFERRTPQYCQLIRHTSRLKRIEFCSHMLAMKETFTDCIFADESTIQVDANVRRCYARKEDETSRFRPRAKHPAKVHIWGGISARGTTDLVLFPGSTRMDSSMYCEILEASCLKFINRRYHGFARLVHDNAPAHCSAYTRRWLQEKRIKTLDWPAESPDLNPIELVWGSMKEFIRKQKVRTVDELESAAKTFWRSLTKEMCANYIKGIYWRMEKVLAADGGNIVEKK